MEIFRIELLLLDDEEEAEEEEEGGNSVVPPKGVGELPDPLDFGCKKLLESPWKANWFAVEVVGA